MSSRREPNARSKLPAELLAAYFADAVHSQQTQETVRKGRDVNLDLEDRFERSNRP